MAMDYSTGAYPKPISRKRVKGRKVRRESLVKQQVRATVEARDGDCRLQHRGLGPCGGASEWAHLEDKRRCHTRGMAPEDRHTTQDSVMFCATHHRAYDRHEITLDYRSDKGADGPMEFARDGYLYRESANDPIWNQPLVVRGERRG